MAVDTTPIALSERRKDADTPNPLRIALPEPRCNSFASSDHKAFSSSPDESPDGEDMQEADANCTVGVSISLVQSRLTSPKTPAVEKAAAIEGLDETFTDSPEQEVDEITSMQHGNTKDSTERQTLPSTPPSKSRSHSATLPSPWQAKARTFEKPRAKDQEGGPINMLADLNVKRFMSNFSMPSMPKTSFKDVSVPSLGSILNTVRSNSPTRKGTSRKKRASTVVVPKREWGTEHERPFEPPHAEARVDAGESKPSESPDLVSGLDGSTEGSLNHNILPQSRPRVIRRSTSDQSLTLRRPTSTSTSASLGDDDRWGHVHEQVNSRAKAIRDSLQDSNIKLPSFPSFSALGSFRPDMRRERANSDARTRDSRMASYKDHPFLDRELPPLPESRPEMRQSQSEQPQTHLDQALELLTGDVVILGGYRGSILRSAKPPHRQLWVPVKVGLNIRKVNLEVGLNPEDEESMEDKIFASAMLSNIGPVDMGRRLLKRLRACRNVQEGKLRVHDYGYDWRLSPHLLSKRFIEFMSQLPSNQPGVPTHERGATVIAHSMGGLITRHAVNQRPKLFAGVVYAGVPQHCVNILGPMRNGDDVLLSSKVLTAQVNFTLRSSYVLLPEDGHCFINKETGEEYPVDFFSASEWQKYAFSPCVGSIQPTGQPAKKSFFDSISDSLPSMPSFPSLPFSSTAANKLDNPNPDATSPHKHDTTTPKVSNALSSPAHARALDPSLGTSHHPNTTTHLSTQVSPITIPHNLALAYLHRTLAQILKFRSELAFKPEHARSNVYPPISLIYANNTPTVMAAKVDSRDAISRADAYDDLKFGSGDGVVLAKAAMLPEGYVSVRGGKVKSERGHVGLLGDLEGLGRCLLGVLAGRREGVGLELEGV
ncbi:MAG: hypothetical protein OHK93_006945 [Ramalina farinacea]|uniref:Uncharacterized protein n=1 Tax=Ramalina farinacea TaxID=258253 RepID=A0AA43QL82_9LECA|nr:hypothetical protein [Ramalina farinacea]